MFFNIFELSRTDEEAETVREGGEDIDKVISTFRTVLKGITTIDCWLWIV